jgi:hypothetical protein
VRRGADSPADLRAAQRHFSDALFLFPCSPPPPPSTGCIGPCKYFDFFKLHRKRGVILSTEPRRDIDMRRWFQEGVQMVVDGTVNTSEMITHIFPLEKVQEAFDLRNNKDAACDAIHVLIDCEAALGGGVKDTVVIPFERAPVHATTAGGAGAAPARAH